MKNPTLLVLVLMFGVSCDANKYIDYESISSSVLKNVTQLDELKDMVASDVPDGYCQIIGKTQILGWNYSHDQWRNGTDTRDSLHEVLMQVGISVERYQRYQELLENVGALDGVFYCEDSIVDGISIEGKAETIIAVAFKIMHVGRFKYGNNCFTKIVSNEGSDMPTSKTENEIKYVVPINEAWYIDTRCS